MKNAKTTNTKRLALRTETVRELSSIDLEDVKGGAEPSECQRNSCVQKAIALP